MNKKQLKLRENILTSFGRRRKEILAKMQSELNEVDRKIIQIEKGQFKLWGGNNKTPIKHRKILMEQGICFVEIKGEGSDIASWDTK